MENFTIKKEPEFTFVSTNEEDTYDEYQHDTLAACDGIKIIKEEAPHTFNIKEEYSELMTEHNCLSDEYGTGTMKHDMNCLTSTDNLSCKSVCEDENQPSSSTSSNIKKRASVVDWKSKKRKCLRVAGKSYINCKGNLVKERKIGEDCHCRRKCYQIVSEEQRCKLFNDYYSLSSHDEQNAYLIGLIRKQAILQKRQKTSDRRTCSYKYFVRIDGEDIQICKLAFAHIHDISVKKIRVICLKQDKNISLPRDGRGKHENRPQKIPEDIINQVKNHINSIVRSDRVREFWKEERHNGPDLHITKMWKDYLKKYEPDFYKLQFGNKKRHHQKHMLQQQQQPQETETQYSSSEILSKQQVKDEKKRPKPIIKHWFYNKTFHDVVKLDDFS